MSIEGPKKSDCLNCPPGQKQKYLLERGSCKGRFEWLQSAIKELNNLIEPDNLL